MRSDFDTHQVSICMKDEMHIGSDDEMHCTADFPVDVDALLAHGIVP